MTVTFLRAGFDLGPWRRRNRSARFELRGQGHQSALRHFGRAAMGDFLQPVGNGPHHDIAAPSWRVGPKESPRHCHVGDFYLSTARSGHRPQTGKSMAWRAPAWYWTPPKSAILGQRDNAVGSNRRRREYRVAASNDWIAH